MLTVAALLEGASLRYGFRRRLLRAGAIDRRWLWNSHVALDS